MEKRQCSFAISSAVYRNGNAAGTSRSHLGQPVCKRRRPPSPHNCSSSGHHGGLFIVASAEEPNSGLNNEKRVSRAMEKRNARMLKQHGQVKGVPPLPPTPAEISGFNGWRAEDDAYWEDFRGREVSFRAPSCFSPEDLEAPPQPLDRYGKPARYPAAAHYDHELEQWVPTSEEEEERLRNPSPVIDPFFVSEAEDGELHTTLFPEIVPDVSDEDDRIRDESEVVMDFSYPDPPAVDMAAHRRKPLNLKPGEWRVVHLGTSSAVPTRTRNVSSTAVIMKPTSNSDPSAEPSLFLVDAGENTDDRLLRCDWCMTHGFRWIRAIFITHLHGDHIYGLPTLLTNIGRYAQYRRRLALENGDDGSDPVIRIYGPYGTRGFVRTSLYWTNPVGVRFSIAELIPRPSDFRHLRGFEDRNEFSDTFVLDCGDTQVRVGADIDVSKESAPPHPEEVRAEDIEASMDGTWHVWEGVENDCRIEVVAAPLRHRLPCFGYVFRESRQPTADAEDSRPAISNESHRESTPLNGNGIARRHVKEGDVFAIDKEKAKELGVHGTQLRVLRSGRSITVSKTGLIVRPEDVAPVPESIQDILFHQEVGTLCSGLASEQKFIRKVTILGDTCDSSAIREAAMDSDLLIHEATFTEALRAKAKVAMHSTAKMAGMFGKEINAKRIALTHFSSRFEIMHGSDEVGEPSRVDARVNGGDSEDLDVDRNDAFAAGEDRGENIEEEEDLVSPNLLVREALLGHGDAKANIIAARDFMEHDIVIASTQSKPVSLLVKSMAENSKASCSN